MTVLRGGRIEFFPVLPKVWCLRRPSYLSCSYVVELDRQVVFVDAGMSSHGDDVILALRELGRGAADVAGCILTHWHNDHSAGSRYLQQYTGCDVFMSASEGVIMCRPLNNSWAGRLSRVIPEEGPLVLFKGLLNGGPGVRLEQFKEVRDRDVLFGRLRIVATPGHTAGHLAVYDENTRTLFCGDALAVVQGEVRRMARPVTENLVEAAASIDRLLELDVEFLCPGHREPIVDARKALVRFREDLRRSSRWPLLG